jgi:hypothetical protein
MAHLILLCENETGYRNLCLLDSLAFTEGFYYRPRIDYALLEAHHEGLIALSACLSGDLSRALLDGRYEDARAFAEGLTLGDGTKCLPALLEPAGAGACYVTVMEGKYHQVKRMLASRGKPVLRLRRLSVGELLLEADLGPGGWRELDENDLCKVLKPDLLEK